MSNSLLDTYLHYGTHAARLAFVPDPPVLGGAVVSVVYMWYETDTDTAWIYTTAWHGPMTPGSLGISQLTGDVTAGPGSGSQAATLAASGVTAGTYGDGSHVAQVVLDAKGRVTSASSVAIASGAPTAHHTTHETGGSDAITALSGAVITTGTVAAARLPARLGAIGMVIDGGGSVLTTGVKGFLSVPFACTILSWTLLSTDAAATAGSVVVDIWKAPYASYPPTVSNTITGSALPTLSSANKNTSSTLTGWTTSIAAGDVLGFNVNSVTTLTRVALTLAIQA